ncbi:hypothetical protein Trco_003152 [Trichoderma cornu-damae]|uniref:Uncharacterized protein n=1 Tax=Trichoderma cornu-damae TaxID=654480 RepID=A0A9P8QP42_9HYPO|nr:hypothetical protein Trco_003152 [Trichoderma cornu-damae]
MENSSLYGFRFLTQSPLLVSDQGEGDYAEIEEEEWQESPEYEAFSPLPSSDDQEASPRSVADDHSDHSYHRRRSDSLFSRVTRRCYEGLRRPESADANPANANPFSRPGNGRDVYEADPLWYSSCSSLAQPRRADDFDEPMWETQEPETPGANICVCGFVGESGSRQYNSTESECSTSTVTMADVSDDGNTAHEMVIDFGDENPFKESDYVRHGVSEQDDSIDVWGSLTGGET